MTVFQMSLHHAPGCQPSTERNIVFSLHLGLHRLCTSSQPALPPQLPGTKQVMLMLVLSCWQGQQGYNLSPPIPDEPADEWHITANAPTVALSGKWDKDERFVRVCTMSPSLWTPVFLAVWADSKEELSSFYSSPPPSCVLTWVSFYGRGMKSVMFILTGKGGVVSCWYS